MNKGKTNKIYIRAKEKVYSKLDLARSPLPLLIRDAIGTIWREGLGQRLAARCQLALKARFLRSEG